MQWGIGFGMLPATLAQDVRKQVRASGAALAPPQSPRARAITKPLGLESRILYPKPQFASDPLAL
jgi:hypothetical protein